MNLMNAREDNLQNVVPQKEVAFDKAEFAQRRHNIRLLMEQAGIDLLYLTAPESRYYVDGYNSDWHQAQAPKDWHALSGVAVHIDHDEVITFEREVNVILVKLTSVAEEVRILAGTDPRSMASFVTDSLRDAGWLPATVGIERYSYRPNPAVSELFSGALRAAGAKVVDGSDVLRDVRRRKSPQELAYIEQAARIGDAGMRAASSAIRAGVTELDVYAEIVHAMVKAGGEHSGKAVSCASGPKTLTTDAQTSHRKIGPGEIVNVDICGCCQRYHTNYARTFSVGEPSASVARQMEISAGAFDRLTEIIRPDVPVNELTKAMKTYYQEAGVWDERWWVGGYDMGLAFAPDWVGPYVYDPEMDAGDDRFEPGMVVNFESDLFLPGRAGLSLIIDTMAFYPDRAQLLHAVPQSLQVVG